MAEMMEEEFYNRLFMYPSDYHYLKAIIKAIDLDEKELWRLYSLMGAQELANTLPLANYKNFRYDENMPQEFRFNLHTHSTYSDGSLSVREWLDNANKIADERVKIKDNLPAFTIALTDHDCIDGTKEIVKILVSQPEKYRNLRVVLGAELGAVWKDESVQRIPFEYELIWFALNPFDKKISDFLTEHHKSRVNAVKEVIRILADKFPEAGLNYEDACIMKPLLGKNQGLGFYNRVNSYVISKIQDESKYAEIYDTCRKFNELFVVEEKFDPFQSTDDIFRLLRETGFGFLGIAHPQKINTSKFIKPEFEQQNYNNGKNPAYELIYKWLNMLRSKGLKAMDINYQFNDDDMIRAQRMLLNEEAIDENFVTYQWLKLFKDYADKYGILASGGYDTHGKDLRTRR